MLKYFVQRTADYDRPTSRTKIQQSLRQKLQENAKRRWLAQTRVTRQHHRRQSYERSLCPLIFYV